MYDVRDIANIILELADSKRVEITNLSLQKLLYFVHGWFYASYESPLVKNKFEAWEYGPVQRVIYDQFKKFKRSAIIGVRATYLDPMTGEQIYKEPKVSMDHIAFIESVLERYANYSAFELVAESHREDSPWEYVWEQAEEAVYPGMKIPDALILDHFKRLDSIFTVH